MIRFLGVGLAALAVAGMAVPAQAGDRKPRRHRDRHDDKVRVGDVALGALLVGVIALASSGKKTRPVDYAAGPVDSAADVAPATPLDADGAAEVCAQAAETQGTRLARIVRVDRIGSVEAAESGWATRGMLVLRDNYRETGDARLRGFRCVVSDAGMPRVTFDGEPADH